MIYRNYAPTGPPAEMIGPPVRLPARTVLLRVALFDKKVKRQEWIVHGKQTLLEVRQAHQALFSSCAHSLPPGATATQRARLLGIDRAQVPGRIAHEA